MIEWKPIETVPDDKPVLLSDGHEVAAGVYAGYSFRNYYSDEPQKAYHVHPQTWEGDGDRGGLAVIDFQPTHWMPLPAAPKEPDNGYHSGSGWGDICATVRMGLGFHHLGVSEMTRASKKGMNARWA